MGKKRTFEEAQNLSKIEASSIDDFLNAIKQRVLMGETLNSFKKEINSIVDLIEEKDPKFERLTDQIGVKLAAIL